MPSIMKQKIFAFGLSLLLTGFVLSSSAQKNNDNIFSRGSVTVNAGVGISAYYLNKPVNNDVATKIALEVGAFNAGTGVLSFGLELGGAFTPEGDYYGYNDYRARMFVAGFRTAWHYSNWKVDRLDTYAGANLGVGFKHWDYNRGPVHETKKKTVFYPRGFVGASYYVTPKFGLNVEAGYDITYIQGGVVFKLN